MKFKLLIVLLLFLGAFYISNGASPTNTMLPGLPGASWSLVSTETYDTGQVDTPKGGFNGQEIGSYGDSSYGVMNEAGTPWETGTDQSAQQYIQSQLFGDFGTSSPPGPEGARFFNFGYTSPDTVNVTGQVTGASQNFPSNALEVRTLSLTNWSNGNPDAGGTATIGQQIYVPVSATLTISQGWGSDEMNMTVIGGDGGASTTFRIDMNLYSSFLADSYALGTVEGYNNLINMNSTINVNDAGKDGGGADNNYQVQWGPGGEQGGAGQSNSISIGGSTTYMDASNAEQTLAHGVGGYSVQGLSGNSVGYGFESDFDILSQLLTDGSAFNITYTGQTEIFFDESGRIGNANGRVSTGPGMEGYAALEVQYEVWEATIPEPSTALLGFLSMAVFFRRKRRGESVLKA